MGKPPLLIADEPTTALDVTIQAQIVELVKRLREELGMAIIWITHDLGVVDYICDPVHQPGGNQKIIQAPSHVIFSGVGQVSPPGIFDFSRI